MNFMALQMADIQNEWNSAWTNQEQCLVWETTGNLPTGINRQTLALPVPVILQL